jgi:hypothetical protein
MPDRSAEPTVAAFVKEQTAFREGLLEEMRERDDLKPHLADDVVQHNYKLVQMGDQFGQILCNRHPFDSAKRKTGPSTTLVSVPVAVGEPDTTLTIDVQDQTSAIVRPWPFDQDELDIKIPARILPQSHYDDHEAFLRDYLKADQVTVTRILRAA